MITPRRKIPAGRAEDNRGLLLIKKISAPQRLASPYGRGAPGGGGEGPLSHGLRRASSPRGGAFGGGGEIPFHRVGADLGVGPLWVPWWVHMQVRPCPTAKPSPLKGEGAEHSEADEVGCGEWDGVLLQYAPSSAPFGGTFPPVWGRLWR